MSWQAGGMGLLEWESLLNLIGKLEAGYWTSQRIHWKTQLAGTQWFISWWEQICLFCFIFKMSLKAVKLFLSSSATLGQANSASSLLTWLSVFQTGEPLQCEARPRLPFTSDSWLKGNFPKTPGWTRWALRPHNRILKFAFIKLITLCTDECICVLRWLIVALTRMEAPCTQGPRSSYSSLYPST